MKKYLHQNSGRFLLIIVTVLCGSCGVFPESNFYLSQDSDLPSWILNAPEFPDDKIPDDLQVSLDFYADNSVIVKVSSVSAGLSFKIRGEFQWIDQNIDGEIGSIRTLSIRAAGETVIFSRTIGGGDTLKVLDNPIPSAQIESRSLDNE